MSEKRSLDPLHRQIYEALDDDAPRLVRADQLMADGDPRGELIAVQCAIANGSAPVEVARRDIEILQVHGRTFIERYGQGAFLFERGFIERVHMPLDVFLDAQQIFVEEAIRELSLDRARLETLWEAEDTDHLAAHPALTYVRELELWPDISHADAGCMLASRQISKLHALRMPACDDATLEQLATTELPSLRELRFETSSHGGVLPYGDRGLGALAGSQTLPALRTLSLGVLSVQRPPCGCHAGLETLAASTLFEGLERLSLSGQQIGGAPLRSLLQTEGGPIAFDLTRCQLDSQDARDIADSARAPRIRELDLRGSVLGIDGVTAVLASERLGQLRKLSLSCTYDLDPFTLERFPITDQLETLDLFGPIGLSTVTRDGFGELRDLTIHLEELEILAQHRFPKLEHLDVKSARRTPNAMRSLEALSGAPWFPQLRSLSLHRLDPDTVHAIDWDRLENLRWLDLRHVENPVVLHILSCALPRLRELHVTTVSTRKGPRARPVPPVRGVVVVTNEGSRLGNLGVKSERPRDPWWRFR